MGVEGIIIGLVILVIAVSFYGTQVGDFYKSITDTIALQNSNANIAKATTTTNNALPLTAKVGQQLCSLKVFFNPKLETPLGHLSPIQVTIDTGAKTINWYSCHSTTPTLAMLWPMLNPSLVNGLQKLDFFNANPSVGGYRFSGMIVADDGSQKNPLVNPVPAIGLSTSTPADGQRFTLTYIYQDIPRQHYVLQVSSTDIGINQGDVGNVYYQDIPK